MGLEGKRARRRHDRWRMVQKAVRLFRRWDNPKTRVLDERGLDVKRRPHDPEKLADNLAFCDHYLCQPQGLSIRDQRRVLSAEEEAA